MQFVGIDLAWKDKNLSGLAILNLTGNGLQLGSAPASVTGVDALLTKLTLSKPSVIAIDAPLIITNQTGSRPCERAISQIYGRFNACAHSTNLDRYPRAPGVKLAALLIRAGYQHLPVAACSAGSVLLEVYPHPALVALFDLNTIIRYKKGRVADKRNGLRLLQSHLLGLTKAELPLVANDPLTAFLGYDMADLAGQALKDYEDQLDAFICAYLAAFAWHWQRTRVDIIGDISSGYIVVPNHTALGTRHLAC